MTTLCIDLSSPLTDATRRLEAELGRWIRLPELLEPLVFAVVEALRAAALDPRAPRRLPVEIVTDADFGTIEVRIRRGRMVDTLLVTVG